jgi:toxin ParE1/3/4
MRFIITPMAEQDVRQAKDWYHDQREGLEFDFVKEIDLIAKIVKDFPLLFPKVFKEIRRANLKIFPFSIFYFIKNDCIYVLAILHNSRDPYIWQKRKD